MIKNTKMLLLRDQREMNTRVKFCAHVDIWALWYCNRAIKTECCFRVLDLVCDQVVFVAESQKQKTKIISLLAETIRLRSVYCVNHLKKYREVQVLLIQSTEKCRFINTKYREVQVHQYKVKRSVGLLIQSTKKCRFINTKYREMQVYHYKVQRSAGL